MGGNRATFKDAQRVHIEIRSTTIARKMNNVQNLAGIDTGRRSSDIVPQDDSDFPL